MARSSSPAENAPSKRAAMRPGPVDHERPGLRLELPGRDRPLRGLVRVVVLVDLLVDEGDAVRGVRLGLLDDVDDRPAHAALAQRRRRERDHDRLVAEDVVEVGLQEVGRGRDPRVELRGVVADVGERARVHADRLLPHVGRAGRPADRVGRVRVGHDQPPVELGDRGDDLPPPAVERDLGDVDRLRRVGVGRRRAALERAVDRQRLRARDERAAQAACRPRARCRCATFAPVTCLPATSYRPKP